MEQIAGYTLVRKIGEGAMSTVYLAEKGGVQYAFKVIKPSTGMDAVESQLRFRQEVAALAKLNQKNLVKVFGAGVDQDRNYLVMELINGGTLRDLIKEKEISEEKFMTIAMGLAEAMAEVHRFSFIHGDIKPENILLDQDQIPKVIDFGLVGEQLEGKSENDSWAGTFFYSSPEQCGILKRPVDNRSDLYSLGVVLFELLARRRPFDETSSSAILTAHATKVAPLVNEFRENIRPGFVQIIAKLLSKDPDDRYQSAKGLLADLQTVDHIERVFIETRSWSLGTRDAKLPSASEMNFVGREKEVEDLLKDWEKVKFRKAGSIILIEGEGGSGKSRLVRELLSKAESDHPALWQGKCNKGESTPFGVIREAIEGYIHSLIRSKNPKIEKVREAAAGSEAILCRFSGALKSILEKNLQVTAEMSDMESFYSAIISFIQKLATLCGPVVFFVDDIQSIDDASIETFGRLIEKLTQTSMLVIGTSRNDPESASVLDRFILATKKGISRRIILKPLEPSSMKRLFELLIGGTLDGNQALDRIIARANGNPFALGQYVRSLIENGVLTFIDSKWGIDEKRLNEVALSSDVVELVVSRMNFLKPETMEFLKAAAVVGRRFETSLMTTILNVPEDLVSKRIEECIYANLIERGLDNSLNFLHDRIREAVLSKVPEQQRKQRHQAVAHALEKYEDGSAEWLFAIARHYYSGIREQNAPEIFKYSLRAGRIAIELSAWEEAHQYLCQAREALPKLSKIENKEAFGTLYMLAISNRRTGRHDEGIDALKEAQKYISAPLDTAKIQALIAGVNEDRILIMNCLKAIQDGLTALGLNPPKNYVFRFIAAFFWFAYAGFLVVTRRRFSILKDEKLEQAKVLAGMYKSGMFLTAGTAMKFACFELTGKAIINYHLMGAQKESIEGYGNLAFVLARFGYRRLSRKVISYMRKMTDQMGDRASVALCKLWDAQATEMCDDPVGAEQLFNSITEEDSRWLSAGFDEHVVNVRFAWNYLSRGLIWQGIEVLEKARRSVDRGQNRNLVMTIFSRGALPLAYSFLGDFPQAMRMLNELQKTMEQYDKTGGHPNISSAFYGWTLAALREQGDYFGRADEAIEKFEKFGRPPRLLYYYYKIHGIYKGYMHLDQFLYCPEDKKGEKLAKLDEILADLKISATHSVHRCHVMVMLAARARVFGDFKRANQYLNEGYELARRVNSHWGLYEITVERARIGAALHDDLLAKKEAMAARELAHHYGWKAKVKKVDREFDISGGAMSTGSATFSGPSMIGSKANSSPAIARITPKKHLDALLQVNMASAVSIDPIKQGKSVLDEIINLLGAERGFIFLKDAEGKPYPLCGRTHAKTDITSLGGFSATVVRKVMEESKPLLVTGTEDAELIGAISAIAHNLRSIIAVPMMVRDKIVGAVYLDSTLAKGVFGEEDFTILSALASQIAVSQEVSSMAKLEVEKTALEKDLAVTGAVQNLLLPQETLIQIPGIHLASFYKSTAQSGGDWWWYQKVEEGRVRVLIGDVTGHGPGAAMMTAAVAMSYVSSQVQDTNRPMKDVLYILSQGLKQISRESYWMTMSVLDFDLKNRKLTWTNAGGVPIFVKDKNGVSMRTLRSMPLGVEIPSIAEETYDIVPGDRVFMYTDGFSELALGDGKQLGYKNLRKLFEEAGTLKNDEARDQFVKKVIELSRNEPLLDDITFCVMDIRDLANDLNKPVAGVEPAQEQKIAA